MVALGTHESRFRIIRVVGEGGMGVVYEAYDTVRKATVALKAIRQIDGDSAYRLKREFRLLADVEHPNLIRLYDMFADDESCFFTMELIRGRNLQAFVESSAGPVSTDPFGDRLDAIRVTVDGLCRGLERLHQAGLLHRDLKPSNILVDGEGRVVVLDFGLVADALGAMQHTFAGTVAGTVAYMAPEQARGDTELTTAVDRYAVGAILYELLTGALPFTGAPLAIVMSKVVRDPKRPRSLVAAIPEDLDELVSALLCRDPTTRPTLADVRRVFGGTSESRSSSSSSKTAEPAMIGRDAEREAILRALVGSAAGRAHLTLVRGRSGIGKTALIGSVCRQVERETSAVVLAGRCYEFETVPFKGLDGVVDSLSRYLSTLPKDELDSLLPPNLDDLATIFPVLRRIAPIASAYARRPVTERTLQRVRAAGIACLRELLRRISDRRPLLIAIDDVQWADEDTSRALVDLLRDANPPAVLALLGSRPNGPSPVTSALFGAMAAPQIDAVRIEIDLAPLDIDATRALLLRELGSSAPTELVSTLARESKGNPFDVCELARFVRDEEGPHESFGDRSIDQVIVERAGSLSQPARALLDVIAIAGEPMDEVVLRRAAKVAEGDRSITDTLRARHFIRSVRLGAATLLDTVHDRIRESIGRALDSTSRADRHRAIALALESAESPPHDRLARHFASAGDRALGFHHAIAAASEARAGVALRRASEFLGLAVELADHEQRVATMPRFAEALAEASMFERAAATWERASALETGDASREYRRRAAEAWMYAGRIDHGLAMLEEAASSLGMTIPKNRFVAFLRAAAERIRLRIRGYRTTLRGASDIPVRVLERLRTLRAMSLAYTPIDPLRAIALQTQWLRAVLDSGHGDDLAFAAMVECAVAASSGDRRAFDRGLALVESADRFVSEEAIEIVKLSVMILWENWNESYRRARELARRMDELAPSVEIPDWLRSFAHYGTFFGTGGEIDPNVWSRIARFVREREELSGPSAELRLRPFVAVHDVAIGQGERSIGLASGLAWSGVAAGEFAGRSIAYAYESWARLACGDIDGARQAALESKRIAISTHVFRFHGARGIILVRLAAAALAKGDRALVRSCVVDFGHAPSGLRASFLAVLRAIDAIARDDGAREALGALASIARDHGRIQFEAAAEWALGTLLDGSAGESHRARVRDIVRGVELVDPDRFFWSILPVGYPPPRRHRPGLIWFDQDC